MTVDPANPFPLYPLGRLCYKDMITHSESVDRWLGLTIEPIEAELVRKTNRHQKSRDHQYWIGLSPRSLQTPYIEIHQILNLLKPEAGATLIDLGAAYGRVGHIIGRHFPNLFFVGFEFVKERVQAGQITLEKFKYQNVQLLQADMQSKKFQLPRAEYYFIYDFGTKQAVQDILESIRKIALSQRVEVVGRGRLVRDLIEREHPWLSQVYKPRHFERFSIYQS